MHYSQKVKMIQKNVRHITLYFEKKRGEAKLTLKGGETGIKRIRVARNFTVPFPLPSSLGPAPLKKEKERKR